MEKFIEWARLQLTEHLTVEPGLRKSGFLIPDAKLTVCGACIWGIQSLSKIKSPVALNEFDTQTYLCESCTAEMFCHLCPWIDEAPEFRHVLCSECYLAYLHIANAINILEFAGAVESVLPVEQD